MCICELAEHTDQSNRLAAREFLRLLFPEVQARTPARGECEEISFL